MNPKKFAIIGAGGFVAPRHMKAIKENGHSLICALDKNDSVGIMDSYFPAADFFTEFERFDRHIEKKRLSGEGIDYLSVCSPNYLHDAHIRFGLRNNADVICEKPLVLNPWNITSLADIEKQTGKKIYNILQLRLHPEIQKLKQRIDAAPADTKHDVELTYITSRGKWYYASWKGDISKSGGIATNIGVHFYDMLQWIFGPVQENIVHIHEHDRASGYLEFAKARVSWFLSISEATIPPAVRAAGKTTYRQLTIDGESIEFSDGFTDLHTKSYQEILNGNGFGLNEAITAIDIVHRIRTQQPTPQNGRQHPFAVLPLLHHPFENE